MNQVTVYDAAEPALVVVYEGLRGQPGAPGATGPAGADGKSFRLRGRWLTGTAYLPGDAVTWRSTANAGVDSLYVLKDDVVADVTNLEPQLHPEYWSEAGATNLAGVFGASWRVLQLGHGFTKIGEPVGYDLPLNRWAAAGARPDDPIALGLVSEVISADEFIVQAVGEIVGIDATLIFGSAPVWEPGRLYYLSDAVGRLQVANPAGAGWRSQPLLMPTTLEPLSGLRRGVVTLAGPSDASDSAPFVGPTPPPQPVPGQLWYRSDMNVGLYVFWVQDDGSYWVQANG